MTTSHVNTGERTRTRKKYIKIYNSNNHNNYDHERKYRKFYNLLMIIYGNLYWYQIICVNINKQNDN